MLKDGVFRMTQKQELKIVQQFGAKSFPDVGRGNGWFSYSLNGYRVWFCSKGWCVAQLIDNLYKNHTYHSTLETALNFANKN